MLGKVWLISVTFSIQQSGGTYIKIMPVRLCGYLTLYPPIKVELIKIPNQFHPNGSII